MGSSDATNYCYVRDERNCQASWKGIKEWLVSFHLVFSNPPILSFGLVVLTTFPPRLHFRFAWCNLHLRAHNPSFTLRIYPCLSLPQSFLDFQPCPASRLLLLPLSPCSLCTLLLGPFSTSRVRMRPRPQLTSSNFRKPSTTSHMHYSHRFILPATTSSRSPTDRVEQHSRKQTPFS